jgi:hypothetical protein
VNSHYLFIIKITHKMGIKKFTGGFIEGLNDYSEKALFEIIALFIDGNQFIYGVLDILKKRLDKKSDNEYVFQGTNTDFWKLISDLCREVVINQLVVPIKKYSCLRHITFCLDGTPCLGKLVQQFLRRKQSVYFLDASGKVLLSDSVVLAGSKLVDLFGKSVVQEFREAFANNGITMEFSLDNIPGEGEHKMLDLLQHSIYFCTKPVLMWSNDSDVPVCLLSKVFRDIYVKTTISKPPKTPKANKEVIAKEHIVVSEMPIVPLEPIFTHEDKVYRLSDLRSQFCADQRDRFNCQAGINFLGNDFLPEMPNTINVVKWYNTFRKATTITNELGTHKIQIINADYTFDPKALLAFLNNFDDYGFYFEQQETRKGIVGEEMFQFSEVFGTKPDNDSQSKLNFKRFYLLNVYSQEVRVPTDENPITDDKLEDLEAKMALSYLETFIWYIYYSNSYYLPLSANTSKSFEPYYKFNYPPLFNSLKMILLSPDRRIDGRCLNDVLNIKPVRRSVSYFPGLIKYKSPIVHASSVLQLRDLLFFVEANLMTEEQYQAIVGVRASIENFFPLDPIRSTFLKTRLSKKYTDGKFYNDGMKAYRKFNINTLMEEIAQRLDIGVSEQLPTMLSIGQIEHHEIAEERNPLFSVGEDLVL